MRAEPIKNSWWFRWKLRNASHGNAAKQLVASDNRKPDTSADFTSFTTAIIALVALLSGIGAYVYVSTRSKTLSEGGTTGITTRTTSGTAAFDQHHVMIPNPGQELQLTLPSTTSVSDEGRYVSVSVPMDLEHPNPDGRNVTVFANGKSFKLEANAGALFVLSSELTQVKWKLVRQWPTDELYDAGT